MAKYIVRFTTKDGDYDKEWTYADSADEAEENVCSGRWDVEEVISVSKL